jgi:hypothetical protein
LTDNFGSGSRPCIALGVEGGPGADFRLMVWYLQCRSVWPEISTRSRKQYRNLILAATWYNPFSNGFSLSYFNSAGRLSAESPQTILYVHGPWKDAPRMVRPATEPATRLLQTKCSSRGLTSSLQSRSTRDVLFML